jgi:hypothetical protein
MFQRCVFPTQPDEWDGKIGKKTWPALKSAAEPEATKPLERLDRLDDIATHLPGIAGNVLGAPAGGPTFPRGHPKGEVAQSWEMRVTGSAGLVVGTVGSIELCLELRSRAPVALPGRSCPACPSKRYTGVVYSLYFWGPASGFLAGLEVFPGTWTAFMSTRPVRPFDFMGAARVQIRGLSSGWFGKSRVFLRVNPYGAGHPFVITWPRQIDLGGVGLSTGFKVGIAGSFGALSVDRLGEGPCGTPMA